MFSDLAHHVDAVAQPSELGTRCRRKDCNFAIFALIAVLHVGSAFARNTKAPACAEAFAVLLESTD